MDVAGYTKIFPMDQGKILSNDQTFNAPYSARLIGARSTCAGHGPVRLAEAGNLVGRPAHGHRAT